jgi:hypothetical protein
MDVGLGMEDGGPNTSKVYWSQSSAVSHNAAVGTTSGGGGTDAMMFFNCNSKEPQLVVPIRIYLVLYLHWILNYR